MATEQSQCFCQICNRHTLHTRNTVETNHLAHALVTLFLCGCWFPVWLIVDVSNSTQNARIPWRCNVCGQAFGQLTPAQLAARQVVRAQLVATAAEGAGDLLWRTLAAIELGLIKIWQLFLASAKRAVPLAASMPGRIDRGLAVVAGDGNVIVHWFLRCLTAAVFFAAAIGLVGVFLSRT